MLLEPKTFLGVRQRSWSSNDLCVDLSHYEAGCVFPKHGHVNAFFCFVLNGASEEYADGRREMIPAGSLIYHPPGFEHSNRWHKEGRCMHVEFAPRFSEGTAPARLSELVAQAGGSRACDIARQIYGELLHLDTASGIAFEGMTLLLIAETIREVCRENKAPRWLRRVRERLQEEYIVAPTLTQVASEVGVHPTYLAASFQLHFGVSVGEFVRARRVERAKEWLVGSEQSLSEMALSLGFSDQSHFCRTFKKQTGMTPLEYRRLFVGSRKLVQSS